MTKQEEIQAHLIACGFEQVSKRRFHRGDTEILFIDHDFIRISIMDRNTGMDLSMIAAMETVDLSVFSAE